MHAQRFQLAVKGRAFHADKAGGAGDIAAETRDLGLNLFYKDIASAQERAKALAVDAAQQFEVDAETVKQLLPEFFQ